MDDAGDDDPRETRYSAAALILLGLLCLGFLALWGCGGPMKVSKPGATTQDLQRDSYECNEQWEHTAGAIAFRQDPMGNAYYGMQSRQYLKDCLAHKGWQVIDG